MIKQKLNKKNYSPNGTKGDKDKREFIKKNLFGIGMAGLAVSVLTTPLSKAVGNSAVVPNLNASLLNTQPASYYRCAGCSYMCSSTCSTGCLSSCTNACTGNCGSTCTGCNGCSGG